MNNNNSGKNSNNPAGKPNKINEPMNLSKFVSKFRHILILLVVMIVLTIIKPGVFLTQDNISNVLWAISVFGIMTCGTISVILSGGIDLSIGSTAGLSGVIIYRTFLARGFNAEAVLPGILLALLVGCLIGVFHGLVVTQFKIPPFLVTLATSSVINGIAIAITNGETFGILEPEAFLRYGRGQNPIYLMALFAILSYILLNKTVFGRKIYAVGGNSIASELSGVRANLITTTAYVLSGFTAALGGLLLSSMAQQASSMMGRGYEMDVITAIVVGGASLAGGEGTIQGAIFGAVLVGLINNGLNLMNVPSTYHPVVKGVVIIAAVAFDFYIKEREQRNPKRASSTT
jgi:ribose transport system permease protein